MHTYKLVYFAYLPYLPDSEHILWSYACIRNTTQVITSVSAVHAMGCILQDACVMSASMSVAHSTGHVEHIPQLTHITMHVIMTSVPGAGGLR